MGRVIGTRYSLLTPLGAGASATVYLAEDLSLRRKVAVKLLHPGLVGDEKFRRRFRAEAQSAAQMSHPHLMAVHDWGDEGEAYLVTELLPGGSLAEMVHDGFRLSISQALVVGLHAAEGLAHAHERGFVHRDIKPANLLFGADGRLRVADFGIARAVAEAAWTEPEGALIGTARYAAPEQAAGSNVDGRVDVYSLGLTLIEAVTGTVPLVESTPLATMLTRQSNDVPRVPELGPLADVIAATGQVDRDLRPTSAELVRLLTGAAGSLPRPKRLPVRTLEQRIDAAPSVGADTDTATSIVDLRADSALVVDLGTGTKRQPSAEEGTSVTSGDSIELAMDLEAPDHPSGDRRRRWPWIVMALLLVASGAALVRYAVNDVFVEAGPAPTTLPPIHPIESFVGLPIEEAVRLVEADNLVVEQHEIRQDNSIVGEVLRQDPTPGFQMREGETVELWVSIGQEPRTVPSVVDATLADARFLLQEQDLLVGSIVYEASESVSVGGVVSQNPVAGLDVEFEDPIDLVLSSGPVQRRVPDLVGLTPDAASAILVELALVFAESADAEYSETVPEGIIISVDQPVGVLVDRDSTLTGVVSLGLPFITVPDVKGMSGAEAAEVLEDAGFIVTATVGSPTGEVIETDPPIGETFRKGKQVRIFTRA